MQINSIMVMMPQEISGCTSVLSHVGVSLRRNICLLSACCGIEHDFRTRSSASNIKYKQHFYMYDNICMIFVQKMRRTTCHKICMQHSRWMCCRTRAVHEFIVCITVLKYKFRFFFKKKITNRLVDFIGCSSLCYNLSTITLNLFICWS
jgi:hypothetical protein